jgi:hypothetical protein
MAALELTVSTGEAFVHQVDFVQDTITATLPDTGDAIIPFLWAVGTTEEDVVAGIDAYIADPSIIVEPNATGLIVDTGSATHPQAEVTGQDMDNNLLQFRWLNGPYAGDCAINFVFTTETTAADLESAIIAIL